MDSLCVMFVIGQCNNLESTCHLHVLSFGHASQSKTLWSFPSLACKTCRAKGKATQFFISASLNMIDFTSHYLKKKKGKKKCIGEVRPDGITTRMPIMRMPFGLISYKLSCEFFSHDDVTNLHALEDYIKWMETMYAHFGNKWACLHNGPMWSYHLG